MNTTQSNKTKVSSKMKDGIMTEQDNATKNDFVENECLNSPMKSKRDGVWLICPYYRQQNHENHQSFIDAPQFPYPSIEMITATIHSKGLPLSQLISAHDIETIHNEIMNDDAIYYIGMIS